VLDFRLTRIISDGDTSSVRGTPLGLSASGGGGVPELKCLATIYFSIGRAQSKSTIPWEMKFIETFGNALAVSYIISRSLQTPLYKIYYIYRAQPLPQLLSSDQNVFAQGRFKFDMYPTRRGIIEQAQLDIHESHVARMALRSKLRLRG
jgi:hypothetical protein